MFDIYANVSVNVDVNVGVNAEFNAVITVQIHPCNHSQRIVELVGG
jgi:hypothetical protein